MSGAVGIDAGDGPAVLVRYWASARAVAGVAEERLPLEAPVTLADLVTRVVALHDAGLARVLGVCSVLVDGAQAGTGDPSAVQVHPGATVEFLPPFAGG